MTTNKTNWKFVDMLIQVRRLKAAHELHSGVRGVEVFLPDASGRIIVIPPYEKVVTSSVTTEKKKPIPKIWNEWADLERSNSR